MSKHILKTSCITYIVYSDKKTARDHLKDNITAQKERNTILLFLNNSRLYWSVIGIINGSILSTCINTFYTIIQGVIGIF